MSTLQPGSVAKEPPKPGTPTVTPPVQATPGTSAAVAAAPAAGEASDGYSYEPKGRRDPFQSLAKLFKTEKGKPDMPPLQRVQLNDLKLLGIIWGGYGYYGLIQTPDGKGYTVKEGMLMGTNNGVITSITANAIIVSEPTIDITGKKSTKEVEILLRPKEVS
jgi:type IV pilus assembly protein PilP